MILRLCFLCAVFLTIVIAATIIHAQEEEAVNNEYLIHSNGVGRIELGMTMGDVKKIAEKEGYTLKKNNKFMVDSTAIEVLKDGERQFALLWTVGEPQSYVHLIHCDNPKFRTYDGVGPGTTLMQAVMNYGKPNLSYSTYNESREYCHFDNWNESGSITFRVGTSKDGEHAGKYEQPEGEYNETKAFKEDAVIQAVEVFPMEGC